MNEQTDQYYAEVISIIEGPPPEFQPPKEIWSLSLSENARLASVMYCQLRTLSGPRMLTRCQTAWAENRPVRLDYPDKMGLRHQADVVAARWTEVEEGHLLHLWVHLSDPSQTDQEV